MDKKTLKKVLSGYWYDNQYYIEKSKEIEKLKYETQKTMDRYKLLNNTNIESDELNKKLSDLVKSQVHEESLLLKIITKKQIIEDLIQLIDQPYRTVLYLKYICFNTIDEIATKTHYSAKRIYQLHDEALIHLLKLSENKSIDISNF